MAALGVVFVWFIYLVLGLSTLRGIHRWANSIATRTKSWAIAQAMVSGTVLVLLVSFHYSDRQRTEEEYVGTYSLSAYPHCPTCVLQLRPDRRFEIRQGSIVKEQGRWHYESGGDYFIVYINENEQLGHGNYAYDTAQYSFSRRSEK
jgi:hypothetical protein